MFLLIFAEDFFLFYFFARLSARLFAHIWAYWWAFWCPGGRFLASGRAFMAPRRTFGHAGGHFGTWARIWAHRRVFGRTGGHLGARWAHGQAFWFPGSVWA